MRKTTMLLGAGSMIPFGAPSTKDITKRLLYFDSCKNLFHVLQQDYKEPCNFETFLSALDLLLEWNLANDNIWDLTYQNTSINKNVFRLAPDLSRYSTNDVWEIYQKAINEIIEVIKEYDYYPQYTHNSVGESCEILLSFIAKYQEACKCKIYTLNYDRLIPNLIRDKLEVYEGLNGVFFEYELNKFTHHRLTYYNLHGSIYIDFDQSSGMKISDFPVELEKPCYIRGGNPNEKKIFLPIIAGYHKSQRMMSNPFIFGFSAFVSDCGDCDTLIIVGYSFSDPHINSVLSNFIKTNTTKIIIVDYSSDKDYICSFLNTIRSVFNMKNQFKKIKDGEYENETIVVYIKGFLSYIQKYLNR